MFIFLKNYKSSTFATNQADAVGGKGTGTVFWRAGKTPGGGENAAKGKTRSIHSKDETNKSGPIKS